MVDSSGPHTAPDDPQDTEVSTSADGGGAVNLPAHPTGTLAIVLIYGVLFAIGWVWIYFVEFLGRGAPTG